MAPQNTPPMTWLCCQLGAREHYSIPRALDSNGRLGTLFTDAWVRPDSLVNKVPISAFKSLGDRYHPALKEASVHAFTPELVSFEVQQRLRKTAAWPRMLARNKWYQAKVIKKLKQLSHQYPADKTVLFSYSYAALEIFKYAKSQGWKTVLGQIDPGIEEEKLVIHEAKKHPELAPNWKPVPPEYWDHWSEECELSDYILVNSNWSKKLLAQGGVPQEKVKTIPLIYQAPANAHGFQRKYPDKFTASRPLRVLFLGLITLRKGIRACLEAIAPFANDNTIEFWFVGSQQVDIPAPYQNTKNIHWVGAVPRSETAEYYKKADVFLFPTLSDGFGLTQLEAQAWRLPIIASKNCGKVVENDINGLVLDQISHKSIIESLTDIKNNPQKLRDFSAAIQLQHQFSIESLSSSLTNLY